MIILGLWNWRYLPGWVAVFGFIGWVLKDLLMYPLLRRAYESDVKPGSQALVGTRGVAQGHLAPRGYVRVRGELWNAIAHPSDQVIFAGTEVEIVSADGMQVIVTTTHRYQQN
jgi:membrane protein implicated in regulation of membrane protease activity